MKRVHATADFNPKEEERFKGEQDKFDSPDSSENESIEDLLGRDVLKKNFHYLVEYYNQKYPDRGKIYHLDLSLIPKSYHEPLTTLIDKIEADKIEDGSKLVLNISGSHSDPCVLFISEGTSEDKKYKLVLLRDSNSFYERMSHKRVEIVYPKVIENKSYQGDSSSCHYIALTILKDLTKEDIESLRGAKDGFLLSAKNLKYSQSITYAAEMDEKLLQQEVKKDGSTLGKYIKTYKETPEDSRIVEKIEIKFLAMINKIDQIRIKTGAQLPEAISVLLKREKERREAKEGKKNQEALSKFLEPESYQKLDGKQQKKSGLEDPENHENATYATCNLI